MACLYLIDEWIPRIVLAMYMQSTHHPLLVAKNFLIHMEFVKWSHESFLTSSQNSLSHLQFQQIQYISTQKSRNCNFAAEHDTSENGQKNVLDQVSKYIYSSSSTTTMLVIRVPCCVALTNLARHQRDRQISPGGIQKKVLHHYTQVLHSIVVQRETQVCSHKLPNW